MPVQRLGDLAVPRLANLPAMTTLLVALNVVFSIVANAAFRVSARSATWSGIVTWQVIGNLAGFVTVVCLTGMLRYLPLAIAVPVTTGMSVLGVQVVAAKWLFHEPVGMAQWVGAAVIAFGIFLVQR